MFVFFFTKVKTSEKGEMTPVKFLKHINSSDFHPQGNVARELRFQKCLCVYMLVPLGVAEARCVSAQLLELLSRDLCHII